MIGIEAGGVHRCREIIFGQVGSLPVTLLDVVPGGWRATGHNHPHESGYSVNLIICGRHVLGAEVFKAASVRLLHLNEWANRSPWTESFGEGQPWTQSLIFTDPGTLSARLPQADVTLSRSLGWSDNYGSAGMSSDEWVHFSFDDPIDLESIEHDYVRPMRYLIELAAVDRSATLSLRLVPLDAEEHDPPVYVLSSVDASTTQPSKNWSDFLFTLRQVEFSVIIPRWWQISTKIGIVSDLIAGLRGRGFVGNQF